MSFLCSRKVAGPPPPTHGDSWTRLRPLSPCQPHHFHSEPMHGTCDCSPEKVPRWKSQRKKVSGEKKVITGLRLRKRTWLPACAPLPRQRRGSPCRPPYPPTMWEMLNPWNFSWFKFLIQATAKNEITDSLSLSLGSLTMKPLDPGTVTILQYRFNKTKQHKPYIAIP